MCRHPQPSATQHATRNTNRFALRLSNTTTPLRQLQRSDQAILLENALLDTTQPAPAIPDHLRAQGDPGSYLVQARGPIDNAFRSLLQAAGATIVSYIPNNAYLVRASAAVAQQLSADPQTQAVLPYEPYYKLKPSLLKLAVAQNPLPDDSALNVLVFADARETVRGGLGEAGRPDRRRRGTFPVWAGAPGRPARRQPARGRRVARRAGGGMGAAARRGQ